MQLLFDLLRFPETLGSRELEVLSSFGVKGAVVSSSESADADREVVRLRQAGIAPFLSFVPSSAALPGPALETELQRLPALLSLPRAVALGPLGVQPASMAREYAFERLLALAGELDRPVVIRGDPAGKDKEMRRVLSMVQASRVAPGRVLAVSMPAPTRTLFREYGYWVGAGLSPALPGPRLVQTVQRLGSERFLLLGEGADFLSLPKAAALLEEAKLPASVIKRVAFENAMRFFGIDEL